MNNLVFKKWVEVLNNMVGFTGFFMVAAFEWQSFIPYIIGLSMLVVSVILEAMYGRN